MKLMKQRDSWKAKAKELATVSPDCATEEQKAAWGEYKILRNKINNMKGKEERLYKQKKVEENIEDTAKVWKVTKTFMGWKTTGSPTQLEEKGKLITSAKVIAQVMNEFFIDKVRLIRKNMKKVAINLVPCMKIMQEKR